MTVETSAGSMETHAPAQPGPDEPAVRAPPLVQNRSYFGMLATQFLGAFNDNLLKQVVLLTCLDQELRLGRDYQPVAQLVFSLPFLLFSGFAGYLSDRFSKRRIVVLCKVAELGIVAAATWALASGELFVIFAILFCMGTHSAFFGPSKFSILPELVRPADLPVANGLYLMTTFLAIILGMAGGGLLKSALAGHAEAVGGTFLTVALLGVATSLIVRPTRAANRTLSFRPGHLFVSRDTLTIFWNERTLWQALLYSSLFWLVGGVVTPTVNAFGKDDLHLDDRLTSLLVASVALGIAAGCASTGFLMRRWTGFRCVWVGAWGIMTCLAVLSTFGLARMAHPGWAAAWLMGLGFFAGMYSVPLQVYLQSRPRAEEKGRVLGAMNLIQWFGILLSVPILEVLNPLVRWAGWPKSTLFGATACLMLVPTLCFRFSSLASRSAQVPAEQPAGSAGG